MLENSTSFSLAKHGFLTPISVRFLQTQANQPHLLTPQQHTQVSEMLAQFSHLLHLIFTLSFGLLLLHKAEQTPAKSYFRPKISTQSSRDEQCPWNKAYKAFELHRSWGSFGLSRKSQALVWCPSHSWHVRAEISTSGYNHPYSG